MLSYRHAYHAGNHADVLKHLVLVHAAQYMASKGKPFWVIDTHAGAGGYSLESPHANKLSEYVDGVGRLWPMTDVPAALTDYMALVRSFNRGEKLRNYPGSPWIASKLLNTDDRLRLFELHSTDARALKKLFAEAGRQVMVSDTDGLAGLKALLPPPPRRALVLIDPSFEMKQDYTLVPQALQEGLKRFASGTFAIWYPQLAKPDSRHFPDKLKKAAGDAEWLHVTLSVRRPPDSGVGMYGSGMFIVNPPWTLGDTLESCMPWLSEQLAQDASAGFRIERSVAPSTGSQPVQAKRSNRRTDQT